MTQPSARKLIDKPIIHRACRGRIAGRRDNCGGDQQLAQFIIKRCIIIIARPGTGYRTWKQVNRQRLNQ